MSWKLGIRGVKGVDRGLWSILACLMVIGSGCSHVSRDELATDLDSVRAEMRAEQQDSADQLNGRIDDMGQRIDGRLDELELRQMETAARLARLESRPVYIIEHDMRRIRNQSLEMFRVIVVDPVRELGP